MSTAIETVKAMTPVARGVRAYFAPVDRSTNTPVAFDLATHGRFALDAPPAPWIDLGRVANFKRMSGTTIEPLRSGSPALAKSQVRQLLEATVELEFLSWGRLQMALATGSQQMNVLTAVDPVPVVDGSTATSVMIGAGDVGAFAVGDIVAVDVDYAAGATGFVGSGVSGSYVSTRGAVAIGADASYIRRVTLNVARIVDITTDSLVPAEPLPAGVPTTAMSVQTICGFVDREGGNFFQEWSGLFVVDGEQGDRVLFHYPRLQAMHGAAEVQSVTTKPLSRWGLAAAFRALPVEDAVDGESILCYRAYLPTTTALI